MKVGKPVGVTSEPARAGVRRVGRGGKGVPAGEAGRVVGGTEPGLDPKYFVHSTPGGTQYRQEIPSQLPTNVRRGAGLVRKEV